MHAEQLRSADVRLRVVPDEPRPFWLGPEGDQFSIFFKQGDPFDLPHWQTPALIDSEAWAVAERTPLQLAFKRDSQLVNYSGTRFDFRIERTVRLLERAAAAKALGAALPASLKVVAFESQNVLVNTGRAAWTKSGGMLSIWILGMFQPTPTTTVVIPYRQGPDSELGPTPERSLTSSTCQTLSRVLTSGKKSVP